MNDIKEKLHSEWVRTVERLEDNSTFVNLRDRFQSQSPITQKVILSFIFILIGYVVLSTPLTWYSSASENIDRFESQRSLIRDLFKVQKEVASTPDIAVPPPAISLKSSVESIIQSAGLLPEQTKGIQILPPQGTELVKLQQTDGAIEVNLLQLNLRQLVDLGYQFQSISTSVKLKDLIVQASAQDAHYFDVIYRLLILKVQPEPIPEIDPPKKAGRK